MFILISLCKRNQSSTPHYYYHIAGLAYLKKCEGTDKFDAEAGVGVDVSAEDIAQIVKSLIEKHNADVLANRFRYNHVLLSMNLEDDVYC